MHRPGRVVLRRIERREIEPVGLALGTVCHVKTHRSKNGLDALQRQGHRVQAALPALSSGQGHIQRFRAQLDIEFSPRQRGAAL